MECLTRNYFFSGVSSALNTLIIDYSSVPEYRDKLNDIKNSFTKSFCDIKAKDIDTVNNINFILLAIDYYKQYGEYKDIIDLYNAKPNLSNDTVWLTMKLKQPCYTF